MLSAQKLLVAVFCVGTCFTFAKFPRASSTHKKETDSKPDAEDTTKGNAEELLNEIIRYGIDQSDFLTDVQERKLYEEGIKLKKTDPAHFVAIFNKQKKRSRELSRFAYASLEASELLARQFMLTRQQVVYGLERVELRQTDLFQSCPFNNEIDDDDDTSNVNSCGEDTIRFRTPDGTCNNLQNRDWGASFTPFLRFLPPVYGDSLGSEFRTSTRNRNRNQNRILPSARRISSMVHRDSSSDTQQFSMMVMQWGQFMDHDVTFTPQKRGFNDSLIKCCSETGDPLPRNLRHRDCFPIEIPKRDEFYAQYNQSCMEFVRSAPASKRDCSLGPRDQMNQVTSFIDGSNIYGSTKEEMDRLRLFKDGKLRYTDLHIRKSLLPPLDHNTASEECRISTPNLHCFQAGDSRVNEQPGLTGLHTLWMREHNRLARGLRELNSHWDDERVFQEARKIVGSMQQHITYNEWLPIVLGPRVLEIFELKLNPRGHYDGYNATINPSIANAFASAALRFGHSLVKNTLSRCNKEFREVPYFVRLHKELNNPANLHNFGSVDRILLGLCSKTLARRDEFITSELTNHLFQNPRTPFGMDLAALNIQRGRDHGLAPYNIWREQCGLRRFRRFSDMTDVLSSRTVRTLERIYDNIDDVDLFTGGLAERPVVGGLVGPTFACILGQQFLNLRKGDRFWYENPNVFSLPQLHEIRKTSLARAICDNLDDIEILQPYAFLMIDEFSNRRVSCKGRGIPAMDLTLWKEEPNTPQGFGGSNSFTPYSASLQNILFGLKQKPQTPHIGGKDDGKKESSMPDHGSDEDLLIRQDKVPFFRETFPFTAEVPKQITRDQYYTFFDTHNDIFGDEVDIGRMTDIPFTARKLLEARLRKADKDKSDLSEKFVQTLFTKMLKSDKNDPDVNFRPKFL